jgi:hypothetical protein
MLQLSHEQIQHAKRNYLVLGGGLDRPWLEDRNVCRCMVHLLLSGRETIKRVDLQPCHDIGICDAFTQQRSQPPRRGPDDPIHDLGGTCLDELDVRFIETPAVAHVRTEACCLLAEAIGLKACSELHVQIHVRDATVSTLDEERFNR